MKVERGMTNLVELPFEETDKIMDGMERAGETNDLEALRWCARRLRWLYNQAETCGTDIDCYAASLFNVAWGSLRELDPPPASIAALVDPNREPEPPTGEAAGEALDTLKAFFEENMAHRKLPDVRKALDDLRGVAAAVGAGEQPCG